MIYPEQTIMIVEIKKWLATGSINIFGMQLSGKDTQGHVLAQLLDGIFLSSGDILRNSVVPEGTKEALRLGNLVPQNEFVDIIVPYLARKEFSAQPLILSSVGRWIGEEQAIIKATSEAQHPIKAVVFLDMTQDTALKRLHTANRNRDDDYEENVLQRIKEFKDKTLPVIKVYNDMGLVVTVDGEKSQDEVTKSILEQLFEKTVAKT